jgi:ABC-type Fe3+/spermidine/putrescine transport system ATPase subunit
MDQEVRQTAGSAALDLLAVSKRYGEVVALNNVDLHVRPSEMLTLLGPSGCGKTTLLKAVAGFIQDVEGDILLGGQSLIRVPPYLRDIGIVFQNYALFPHYTVAENVAFGLRMRNVGRAEIRKRVSQALSLVQLQGFEERHPRQLSGGQQQRVALARVLVLSPRLLLLDEPFGALDRKLRMQMQVELKQLLKPLGITTILVTHDQEEAMTLSDRIAVMHKGRLIQCAEPLEIYDRPADTYVADFIGVTNLVPTRLVSGPPRAEVDAHGVRVAIAPENAPSARDGAYLAVRPENLTFDQSSENAWTGQLSLALPAGPRIDYEVVLDSGVRLRVSAARDGVMDERGLPVVGSIVHVKIVNPARCRLVLEA